jgi:hypothetical protein
MRNTHHGLTGGLPAATALVGAQKTRYRCAAAIPIDMNLH